MGLGIARTASHPRSAAPEVFPDDYGGSTAIGTVKKPFDSQGGNRGRRRISMINGSRLAGNQRAASGRDPIPLSDAFAVMASVSPVNSVATPTVHKSAQSGQSVDRLMPPVPISGIRKLRLGSCRFGVSTTPGSTGTPGQQINEYFVGSTFDSSGNQTADGTQYNWTILYQGENQDALPGVYITPQGAFNPREQSLLAPDLSVIQAGIGASAYDPLAGETGFQAFLGRHYQGIALGASAVAGAAVTMASAGLATPWVAGVLGVEAASLGVAGTAAVGAISGAAGGAAAGFAYSAGMGGSPLQIAQATGENALFSGAAGGVFGGVGGWVGDLLGRPAAVAPYSGAAALAAFENEGGALGPAAVDETELTELDKLRINMVGGSQAELDAQEMAQQNGETVIQSQYMQGNVKRGFDFLSFKGWGSTARLFINEVKNYSSAVPLGKFTTFGFGPSGMATYDQAMRVAESAIMEAGLDRDTTLALLSQLRNGGAAIRLIGGPETQFSANVLEQIGQQTGFITGQGFTLP